MLYLHFLPLLLLLQSTSGFLLPGARKSSPLSVVPLKNQRQHQNLDLKPINDNETPLGPRRQVLRQGIMAAALLVSTPLTAQAGIDPAALKSLRVEGDETGGATRLRQIQAASTVESDSVDGPWEELSSGVSFREYRQGRGDAGTYCIQYTAFKCMCAVCVVSSWLATSSKPIGYCVACVWA